MALLHMLRPRRRRSRIPFSFWIVSRSGASLATCLGASRMPWLRLCPLIVSHRLSRMLPVRAISPLSTPL